MRWRDIDRRRMIYVRKYTASFQRSLRLQIAPVIEDLGTKLPQDIEVNLDPGPVKKVFLRLYPETGVDFARSTSRELSKGRKEDMTNIWEQEMRAFMEMYAGERIVSITGSSKDIAVRILRELAETQVIPEGLSIEQTTRLLQKKFHEAYIKTTLARARVIAQTEVLTASNKGSHEGAIFAGATEKIWQTSGIASPDGKDRHIAYPGLHGQVRAINDKYDVGGYPASYPGDPTLPVGEIVNCKCAEIYR